MDRYITKDIQIALPIEVVMLIWQWIDEELPVKRDYLQVIRINRVASGIEVKISQEVPIYERKYIVPIEIQQDYKLFCIEENTYQILMLAEEY